MPNDKGTQLILALVIILAGTATGQIGGSKPFSAIVQKDIESPSQGMHITEEIDVTLGGNYIFAVALDRTDQSGCSLVELAINYKRVFAVPCADGDPFLATGWTRLRAYGCLHEIGLTAAYKANQLQRAKILAKCVPDIEEGHESWGMETGPWDDHVEVDINTLPPGIPQ